jgi:hypothetical protein
VVELVGDGEIFGWEYVLFHDGFEADIFLPAEDGGEMLKIARHEGVESVIIGQEEHAVLHEIVYKLTKNYLFRHSCVEFQQRGFYFRQRFMCLEDVEICFCNCQSKFMILMAEPFDNFKCVLGNEAVAGEIGLHFMDVAGQF